METAERRATRHEEARAPRPSFSVVTGGGLDARARRGVSATFLMRVKLAVAVSMTLIALGVCRVALTTASVSLLQGNVTLRSEIKEAKAYNDDLQVERSVLSSASRIDRIATQNYGMVLSGSYDVLDLTATKDSASATADEASAPTDSEVSGTTQTDGEAAQTAEETDAAASEA
jgi:cell division protein FtsL